MAALQERLAYWQKRLGLQDWSIKLELRDPQVFPEDGLVNWNGDTRTATIIIRDGGHDGEALLVHELMHLHYVDCELALNILEPFLGSIALEIAKQHMRVGIERAVEKLTTALLPS